MSTSEYPRNASTKQFQRVPYLVVLQVLGTVEEGKENAPGAPAVTTDDTHCTQRLTSHSD